MNSLEWINAEITKWQEILESFKEQLIRVKGTRNEETTLNHIEANELKLKYLQQIKSELEAWYVVKPKIEIKEMEDNGVLSKDFYRKYWTCNEYGVRDKEQVEKIEKALEVEESDS